MHGHCLRLTVCDVQRRACALWLVVATPACNGDRTESRAPARTEASPVRAPQRPAAPTAVDLAALRRAAPARVVAIGDVHGDVAATRRALRLAGVVDDRDRWTGGDTVVVQTGDQLDRGDDERAILDLLENVGREAKAAGGAVVVLNGNHEVMNVVGDFRYVTEGGFRDFADGAGADLGAAAIAEMPEPMRGRAAAFAPGGPIAKRLAQRSIAAIVGGTAFAHGGILPEHVAGLATLDADVRAWMEGNASEAAARATVEKIMDPEGPIWTRVYAEDGEQVCQRLERALTAMDARRMVVGHTVQKNGITSACDGRLWRIDVGLAAHYGGPTQVLEIRGDKVTVLGD
jgi:hypothetical protein